MSKIRVGITGYGNLGRGTESAILQNDDMELVAIFSRRPIEGGLFQPLSEVAQWQDKIDVMVLCGGSATDLPEQGPQLAALFNTVDSYDTHALIPEYFEKMQGIAEQAGKVAVISTGWDPGLFSLARTLSSAVLPQGEEHTFWGRGVSQGHSDAIRRVEGVQDARQYTIPRQEALDSVRSVSNAPLTTREKHLRECFVVAQEGADTARIEQEIVQMPHYFADYDTVVHFISQEELQRDHAALPHGGFVLRSGQTGDGNRHLIEFGLKLDSNPEFTANVLVAYARAAYRLHTAGDKGAKTVFDIPFGLLSPRSAAELRRDLL
jgi:diaminopimelate dehydrogenase